VIQPFVTAEELAGLGPVALLDVGVNGDGVPPLEAFISGHLPGAAFLDMDRWAAGPATDQGGRHPLPEPGVFAEGMRRAGVGRQQAVVAYDRVGGVFAARLVWLLRSIGHPAALLDGGMNAVGTDRERGEATPELGDFTAVTWPAERFADMAEVERIGRECVEGTATTVLLDARERARYEGEAHPLDIKQGHIPGARSLPCRENVDGDGRLLPLPVLSSRLVSLGVSSAQSPVISSCGSGITACHTLLIMEHVGLGRGRLYVGSWSQWCASERPIAVGHDPCADLVAPEHPLPSRDGSG
jgi:thiosulfate/3-mercaptopyruvate sulfurtransferase